MFADLSAESNEHLTFELFNGIVGEVFGIIGSDCSKLRILYTPIFWGAESEVTSGGVQLNAILMFWQCYALQERTEGANELLMQLVNQEGR